MQVPLELPLRSYLAQATAVTLGAEAAGGVHDVLVSGVTTHSVLAPVHLQVICRSLWLGAGCGL